MTNGVEPKIDKNDIKWLVVFIIKNFLVILGDFMIKNDTFESTYAFYNWPKPYRLFYKIMNHDDLLSFAQFDIVDTEVSLFR